MASADDDNEDDDSTPALPTAAPGYGDLFSYIAAQKAMVSPYTKSSSGLNLPELGGNPTSLAYLAGPPPSLADFDVGAMNTDVITGNPIFGIPDQPSTYSQDNSEQLQVPWGNNQLSISGDQGYAYLSYLRKLADVGKGQVMFQANAGLQPMPTEDSNRVFSPADYNFGINYQRPF